MTVAEKVGVKTDASSAWQYAFGALVAEVTEWSYSQGWRTVIRDKQVVDESTQKELPMSVLDIITEREYSGLSREVKLVLEPVTFRSESGVGRVDLYVWPAMYRVRLLQDGHDEEWKVKTDSGIFWPLPWNEKNFVQIAEGLLGT